jgi:CBS domain-containing protein
MHVASVLKHYGNIVATVAPKAGVDHAARLMFKHRTGAVAVVDSENRPVGILTERDITRIIAQEGSAYSEMRVEQLMAEHLPACQMDESHHQVMPRMSELRVRYLPVVDGDGRFAGIIGIDAVVAAQLDEAEMEVDDFRRYAAEIG